MRPSTLTTMILLLGGCRGPALVVVHVDAASPVSGVAAFVGTAAASARTVSFAIHPSGGSVSIPPEQTFGIQLPSSVLGPIAVHVDAQDAAGATVASGDGAAMIAPGGRSELMLLLNRGVATFDMSMGSSVDAALPVLTISPSSFDFGSAARSSTGTMKSFVVTNGGTANTEVLASAAIVGTSGSSFALVNDGCSSMSLTPGASCMITVQLAPQSAGVLSGSLQVGAATARLSGLGVGVWHAERAAADLSGSSGGDTLTTVWGAGPLDVWVAGYYNPDNGIIFHRDMTGTWMIAGTPTVAKLYGLWGTSATDVFAVGGDIGATHASVLHSTGAAFTDLFSYPQSQANGIFGFSSTNLYLAWSSGTAPAPHAGIWHSSDGKTFSAQNGSAGAGVPPDGMTAVWGSAPNDVYAAGSGIFHSVGDGAWFSQSTMTASAITGSSATDLYAVGPAGTILHSKGDGAWAPQTATGGDFYGVWQSGPNDIWVVGVNGTILRSNGNGTWTAPASSMTTVPLRAIWGSSSGDIYVVGDFGTILHYY